MVRSFKIENVVYKNWIMLIHCLEQINNFTWAHAEHKNDWKNFQWFIHHLLSSRTISKCKIKLYNFEIFSNTSSIWNQRLAPVLSSNLYVQCCQTIIGSVASITHRVSSEFICTINTIDKYGIYRQNSINSFYS